MKKSQLVDMLEQLSKAHALTEYVHAYLPDGQSRGMTQSAKFYVSDALDTVRKELKK